MNKIMTGAVSALTALSFVLTPVAASAQERRSDRDRSWSHDRDDRGDHRNWRHDRDRDGRADRGDRHDNRRDGRRAQRWSYYGGDHGYSGYRGSWRTGQRYPHYRDNRYLIQNYGDYDLPPPRRGYRYHRDNNGDIVMVAIASGIIGLIIGGALSDNNSDRRW